MSTIKVNTVTKRTGSTLTLGESGTTVTLACGASQSGFGRTGTVDWCTTAKTSPFTSESGKGYFVNTTSGAVTVTLPASPNAGDIVSVADYTNTFQTNNVTIARNGSKIGGICACATLNTEGQSVTFVYVDGTEGWKNVQDSTSNVIGQTFMSATGGTVTTCGNFKVHTFTSDGTFCVSSVSNLAANNEVSYVVVAGGGGGGTRRGGAGGAGGYRENKSGIDTYTASPKNGSTPITVTATGFPITVGGGGAGNPSPSHPPSTTGCAGSNSVFSTITSAGGGFGGNNNPPGDSLGGNGGSGGGAGGQSCATGGSGNTPPVSPPQGFDGGDDGRPSPPGEGGGGGGGATAAGGNSANAQAGNGGAGATSNITGSPVTRAGGGGGGTSQTSEPFAGTGGSGGGGRGGYGSCATYRDGVAGTTNTGGGGGGSACVPVPTPVNGGSGGSGIVVIRYKFQ